MKGTLWRVPWLAVALIAAACSGPGAWASVEDRINHAIPPGVKLIQAKANQIASNEYANLNQEVIRWAGKPIDSFQGKYGGRTFIVGEL